MIFDDLKRFWRIVRKIAFIFVCMMLFFTIMEIIRAYQTLRDIHPYVGYGFAVIVTVLVAYAAWRVRLAFKQRPRVLVAPPPEKHKKYGRYLEKYMDRMAHNELLDDNQKQELIAQREKLRQRLEANSDEKSLIIAIELAETQGIEPALKCLDKKAEEKIRAGVRDIMLAVTLSPYRTIDLIVVLYRNVSIVQDIARVYNSRPRLRETMAIIYDTVRVVATVNFVNLGTKMLENISRGLPGIIPGVSRIVDDCTEGLAAGVLTSVTGHAAKLRCHAFRKWDYQEARETIATHLKTFTSDVGKMFFRDVIPHIKIPGGVALEKWKDIKVGFFKGFNETVGVVQNFVRSRNKKNA